MNGDGVLKVFLGIMIMTLFGFMGWAVMEHYKDHDQHLRDRYDQLVIDHKHDVNHQRILEGVDRHEENAESRDREHKSYYCPECRGNVDRCSHYRQYDPYHNNGYYFCPNCIRLVRNCSHGWLCNPYYQNYR